MIRKPKFQFANVVVVEKTLVGCIVKTWTDGKGGYEYEVYVRSWNGVTTRKEDEIEHFVYDKELPDEGEEDD